MGRAWWTANISGKDEDFAKKEETENRLNEALANRENFQRLKKIHEGTISDAVLKRTIDVLYLQYLDKQVDPALLSQITALEKEVEQGFKDLVTALSVVQPPIYEKGGRPTDTSVDPTAVIFIDS